MKVRKLIPLLCLLISGSVRAISYPFTTVDSPGFHILYTNVSNQITISASDVTLDLNGATVSGGTNGIVINSGLSNVTIKNGVISSVSSDGIQVGAGCSDITLKDITVSNAIRGMYFSQVTNALLRNCDLSQSTTGLLLDTCHNILVEDCTANANTHAGFDLLTSTTCSLIECQALATGDGNGDIASEVFGFVASSGNGNIFERCIANATQALSVTGDDSIVAGFALRGSEGCTKIIDSESSNSETNPYGLTVPYGIWLEGAIDNVHTVTGLEGVFVASTEWSPDGQYIAIGGDALPNDGSIVVASFDPVAETVLTAYSQSFNANSINSVRWSPDGRYIAFSVSFPVDTASHVVQIGAFNRTDNSFKIIGSILPYNSSEFMRDVAWSPDQQFLAIGGSLSTNVLQVLSVDLATGNLASVAGALGTAGTVRRVDWSPDGNYIAMVGDSLTGGTGEQCQVFSFDKATSTLSALDGGCGTTSFMNDVAWSPDGNYIAVAGNAITTGSSNQLQIFSFDRTTDMLISVTGYFNDSGYEVLSIAWSPDGKYLVASGSSGSLPTGKAFVILEFDKGSQSLFPISAPFPVAGEGTNRSNSWSPDGRFIAGQLGSASNLFNVISAIEFPQSNVIKGNTVYCNSGAQFPSGVGISAPSITNMIIGNTAFNNPIPRAAYEPVVATNYQFVTNVFNQLFGEGPSLTQNISTSALNPLPIVPDVPAKIKRTELLLESLIDNLL